MSEADNAPVRNRWKVPAALAAAALAGALALGGCSSAGAPATLSAEVNGSEAMATVTAVDGNTVTVSLSPGGADGAGEPPEKPDGAAGDGAQPPDKPGNADAGASSAGASGSEDGAASADAGGGESAGDADVASSESADGQETASVPAEKPDGAGADPSSGSAGSDSGGDAGDTGSSSSDTGSESDAGPADAHAAEGSPAAGPSQAADGGRPDGAPGGTEATLTVEDQGIIYKTKDGQEVQGSLSDVTVGARLSLSVEGGTTVTKVLVEDGQGQPGGAPDGGSGAVTNGSGATTIDSDATTSGETYESQAADENALRVENGAEATVDGATIAKTGDSSSSEDSDFYGLNAGVLAYDGSKLTLADADVSTDAAGANGVFAYGEGTQVAVSGTTVKTRQGNSGGIEVAGGAALTATDLDVETQGESSAAIRSDRGGGTETVTGGSYATHGAHSPAVYSTADVTVSDAKLSAENSEAIVVEGKNSVALDDCDVTGNVNGAATRTGVVSNVMIYQSMSGDAGEGQGSFTMKGGSFDARNGTLFYVTNTDATISLEDVDIANGGGQLLVAAGNDGQWGTQGENGGAVSFTATDQELSGSIEVDGESSLDFALAGGSAYTGAINESGDAGEVNVTLSDGSTWTLDGDSYISSLSGDTAGIDLNGHTLYVDGEAWSK